MSEKYCVGFLFSLDLQRVVMIRKNRPDWQSGSYNGPGGKIETNEHPTRAMSREFFEETGLLWPMNLWEPFYIETFHNGIKVTYFMSQADDETLKKIRSVTDEPVAIHKVADILEWKPIVSNLKYVIPMALSLIKQPKATWPLMFG